MDSLKPAPKNSPLTDALSLEGMQTALLQPLSRVSENRHVFTTQKLISKQKEQCKMLTGQQKQADDDTKGDTRVA